MFINFLYDFKKKIDNIIVFFFFFVFLLLVKIYIKNWLR
jgi:hypothetical protein